MEKDPETVKEVEEAKPEQKN